MICYSCGEQKDTKGTSLCKNCKKTYDKNYYKKKENRKAQQQRVKDRRIELRLWVRSLKEGQPCVDCGRIYHFSVMDWDHRPGTEKLGEIKVIVEKTGSRRRVLEEIAKCDLRCANCHRLKTYERNQLSVSPTAF